MKKFVLFILTILALFSFTACSHIEDTNGAEDHSPVTLTDEDFLKGYNSGISYMFSSKTINHMTEINVKKFSGNEILERKIRASGEDLNINTDTGLAAGNLRICIVRNNKEIVAEIDIHGNDEILIENADGVYTIVIGGESANFAFTYTYQLTNLPE